MLTLLSEIHHVVTELLPARLAVACPCGFAQCPPPPALCAHTALSFQSWQILRVLPGASQFLSWRCFSIFLFFW